jgi:3-hydroxy-9,10-secoandrosta-1,3,5(10)-triene-9,17-dione monooxygenase reductase component
MSDSFNGEHLREVMRNVASPVTVVTYLDGDQPRGVTIGSFTSVSLDPPLISFNVSSESSAHDVLPFVDRLNVNVLSTAQAHVASHFALSGLSSELQFAPVITHDDEDGIPILSEAVATLFCGRVKNLVAGDSTILVAEVLAASHPADARPLLYFRQQYHAVGDDVGQLDDEVNRVSSSTP